MQLYILVLTRYQHIGPCEDSEHTRDSYSKLQNRIV